jgi:hypothetical protein
MLLGDAGLETKVETATGPPGRPLVRPPSNETLSQPGPALPSFVSQFVTGLRFVVQQVVRAGDIVRVAGSSKEGV